MSHTRVVAVIPARYGSQRLPAKPLAEIAGKPMIQHVYERACAAELVDAALVATDDKRIAEAVRAFGGRAVITPESIQSGSDRVALVAQSLPDADIIVNVQGDEPLLPPKMIDEAIRVVLDDMRAKVGTLVRKIEHIADLTNPNVVKAVLDRENFCLFFSRSPLPFGRDVDQSAWLHHHTYFKHVGLYAFRREFLLKFTTMTPTPLELTEKLEQLRILENGYKIKAAITEHDSIPVDTEADLARVRSLLQTTAP